jgi:hypothetical protein
MNQFWLFSLIEIRWYKHAHWFSWNILCIRVCHCFILFLSFGECEKFSLMLKASILHDLEISYFILIQVILFSQHPLLLETESNYSIFLQLEYYLNAKPKALTFLSWIHLWMKILNN